MRLEVPLAMDGQLLVDETYFQVVPSYAVHHFQGCQRATSAGGSVHHRSPKIAV